MAIILLQCRHVLHHSFQSVLVRTATHASYSCQATSFRTLLADQKCKKNLLGNSSFELAKFRSSGLSTNSQRSLSNLKILENLKQLPRSPAAALGLGLAGLLPFACAPYMMISSGHFLPDVALYQSFYGATILSFLGGVRWGFTVPAGSPQNPDINNLGYSVLPQIWGCSCLVLGHYMDCIVVANTGVTLGLCVTAFMDLSMPGYPAWFKGIRLCLTVGAVLSLLSVIMCKFVLAEERNMKSNEDA
ncbi:Protein of unknown function DUF3429 [Trinorchestia longiramus]|nr:Protein of unknown function DUF3429 [Trinorchestia longiramus]